MLMVPHKTVAENWSCYASSSRSSSYAIRKALTASCPSSTAQPTGSRGRSLRHAVNAAANTSASASLIVSSTVVSWVRVDEPLIYRPRRHVNGFFRMGLRPWRTMHTIAPMDIAAQIRQRREALGSQMVVAVKAEVSIPALHRLETGKDTKVSTLRSVARALGCELLLVPLPSETVTGAES